ncbi:Putative methyltransferase-like protein [Sparassis crispa]|uniref:Methyltransferase-like protein n=1 Tax=Sparassis crispa TaxID=139825 RepID=A0A401GNC7_9APHY|nr:Putative methyltransferase-like protein [Sparassis crispa]GBE83680.1 Putative methyltransferase-like protein [Sparassis crispa]
MHPRNPYRTPPDFSYLAKQYPALKPYLISKATGTTINFKDNEGQRRLTEALLHRDFQLSVTIPDDRLCPPVPNRLNYILWMQDIVHATSIAEPEISKRIIKGVDIGTGASAIYPLLGCQINPQWRFTATDVDDHSLQCARLNVQQNNLQDRITVVQSDPAGPVILSLFPNCTPEKVESTETSDMDFEFIMCNPPFYSSREDILHSAEAKEFEPTSVCTGADVEMITPGGEAAFVRKIVNESLTLKTRCRWYTSMLGKMSSLTDVVALLREKNIANYACTEFVQGQTRRWAIAWSFGDVHLPDSLGRVANPALQRLMPPRNTLRQSYPGTIPNRFASVTVSILSSIDSVSVQPCAEAARRPLDLLVTAHRDTWSRASRRRKADPGTIQTDVDSRPTFLCRIRNIGDNAGVPQTTQGGDGSALVFDWVRGIDRALFESFASHVGRKVSAMLISDVS